MKEQNFLMEPVRKEVLGAKDFLRLTKEASPMIERSRFIPPRLGSGGFGEFEVVYSVPMLRPISSKL
jgi:hypothetical protein